MECDVSRGIIVLAEVRHGVHWDAELSELESAEVRGGGTPWPEQKRTADRPDVKKL